jgi:acetoin utilization deacetylase AcuC-like enzyme
VSGRNDPGAQETLPTAVVIQPGQARHQTGGHPESHLRLEAVIDHLEGLPSWSLRTVIEAEPVGTDSVEACHPESHLETVRRAAESGGGWLDGDTPVSPLSFETALEACGGAVGAVDSVFEPATGNRGAFALIRPPGHHATIDRAMGFCLFNNAAVAARHAQREHGIERVAIIDWDVHHGNGTQDIFYGDPTVLFISLHQWPLYPGTGWLDETGREDGAGSTVNIPIPPGAGDRNWVEAFERVVEPTVKAFEPGLVIVSAGQDGHYADGLSNQALTEVGYLTMAHRVGSVARDLGAGLVAVHEGGYNPDTLPTLDRLILEGFDAGLNGEAAPGSAGLDPSAGLDAAEWEGRLEEVTTSQRPFRNL